MLNRISSILLSAILITLVLVVATTKNAYAYIDIATGSYLIQMLVAVSISSLLAIKIFWHRLFSKVSSIFSRIRRSSPEAK